MTMDVEAEIRDLKRRVSEIEGSFGFLTQQIKGVHKDLLTPLICWVKNPEPSISLTRRFSSRISASTFIGMGNTYHTGAP